MRLKLNPRLKQYLEDNASRIPEFINGKSELHYQSYHIYKSIFITLNKVAESSILPEIMIGKHCMDIERKLNDIHCITDYYLRDKFYSLLLIQIHQMEIFCTQLEEYESASNLYKLYKYVQSS